jgi:hypothetical protein
MNGLKSWPRRHKVGGCIVRWWMVMSLVTSLPRLGADGFNLSVSFINCTYIHKCKYISIHIYK